MGAFSSPTVRGSISLAPGREMVFSPEEGNISNGQKLFIIPGGYPPGFLSAYAGDLEIRDLVAFDGETATINFPDITAEDTITFVVRADTGSVGAGGPAADIQALLALLDRLPWAPEPGVPLTQRGLFKEGTPGSTSYRLVVLGP